MSGLADTSIRSPRTPLQRILREQGRSQRWLARQVGKHETEVSKIANGWLIPSEATKAAIAEALGLHIDVVFPAEPQRAAA